jgi:hypothetical protein
MKGLKEATAGFHLDWRDRLVEKGRLAFKMGIELRNNPEKDERNAKLFKQGWELESAKFAEGQRKDRFRG